MTKKTLAELVLTAEELKHIDYALPQQFITDAENLLGMDRNEITGSYVWCYIDHRYKVGEPGRISVTGQPLNLIFRFCIKYNMAPDLLKVSTELLATGIKKGFLYSNEQKENIREDFQMFYNNVILMLEHTENCMLDVLVKFVAP